MVKLPKPIQALVLAGALGSAVHGVGAQTFNDPSYSVPNYIQSSQQESLQKGQIKGAICFFTFNNQVYYLWNDERVVSEDGKESYFLKDGKYVSDSGKILPSEFNNELKKAMDVVKLKETKDNARVVDYFTYVNPKNNEKNAFMIFSDGTSGFKYGFYDVDKGGVFFDSNNNQKREKGDIPMSKEFSEKFISKLENLFQKKGMPSQLTFPPLTPEEKMRISNQIEDYTDSKRLVNNYDDTKVWEAIAQLRNIPGYDDSGIKTDIKQLSGKYDKLETIIQDMGSANKTLGDSLLDKLENNEKEIAELRKEIESAKKSPGYDISELEDRLNYLIGENTTIKSIQQDLASLKGLEGIIASQGADINLLKDKPGYDDSEVWKAIQGLKDRPGYDDSEVWKAITGILYRLNEDEAKTLENSLSISNIDYTLKNYDTKSKEGTSDSSKDKNSEEPKIEKPKEVIIETKGTQIEEMLGLTSSKANSEEVSPEKQETEIRISDQYISPTIVPTSEVPENGTPIPISDKSKLEELKKDETGKISKRKPGLGFVVSPEVTFEQDEKDTFGLRTGIIYDFNDLVGLGANISFRMPEDKLIEFYQSEISPITGRYFEGSITSKTRKVLGGNLELRVSNFLLGAGMNIESGINETKEQIIKHNNDEDIILAQNTGAEGYSINSFNGYIGLDFPINQNFALRGYLGYENQGKDDEGKSKDNFFLGVGGTIKLGSSLNNPSKNQGK